MTNEGFDFMAELENAIGSTPSKCDEDDYYTDEEYIRIIDELKSDFNSYRKRTENNLKENENRMKEKLMIGFINDFVLYFISVYRSKKECNRLNDEDILTLAKLDSFLKSNGVEPMEDCLFHEFDHETMDAVCVDQGNTAYPSGIVTKVVSNGFKMNGKVIVPFKVMVAP